MSAKKAGQPIFVYLNKAGEKQLLWHKEHKLGDKIVYLKYLKKMAQLHELKADIAKFEAWKREPGFPDDKEEQ